MIREIAYRVASNGRRWKEVVLESPPSPGELARDYVQAARELYELVDDDEDGANFEEALYGIGLKRHRNPKTREYHIVDYNDTLGELREKHRIPY